VCARQLLVADRVVTAPGASASFHVLSAQETSSLKRNEGFPKVSELEVSYVKGICKQSRNTEHEGPPFVGC
jgi:hypothetical protein